jgi:hypothetical protein
MHYRASNFSRALRKRPTLFATVSPNTQPGGYYDPSGFQELKGYPVSAKIAPAATDVATAKRLWAESEQLTGVRFEALPAPS